MTQPPHEQSEGSPQAGQDSLPEPGPGEAPGPPDRPRRDLAPVFVLVGAVAVLVSLLVVGAFLVVSRSGGSGADDAPTSASLGPTATTTPAGGGGSHDLTGTFSYPGDCDPQLGMRVLDAQGGVIVDVGVESDDGDDGCVASLSAKLPPADSYTLALVMGEGSGEQAHAEGPTYTAAELAAADYEVTLTVDDFGGDAARFEVEADLNRAIDAARRYYERRGTFEGLTPSELRRLEPSLRFDESTVAAEGVVSLRLADETMVLFAEMTADGTPIVMGFHPPNTICYGEIDTDSFRKCLDWQPWDTDADGKPDAGSSPVPM